MYNRSLGLTEFLLLEEKKHTESSGSLTHLLMQLEHAGKIIASHIRQAGLVDILGKTGEQNYYQEEVTKLDRFSNDLLMDTLTNSGEVYAIASEELSEMHLIDKEHGKYIVYLDPLDGSSNIDSNAPVGTIFSIYKKSDSLPIGNEQVAAGYILYGTSVMFVYSTGNDVHGFTLDPSIGAFLLSHPKITIPEKGFSYSFNDARSPLMDEKYLQFIDALRKESYKSRYIGTMVADVHRMLLKGGIFFYPNDHEFTEGKLRLMIEINPFSFLVKQAGGKAYAKNEDPLLIRPQTVHDRAPIVMGGRFEMSLYEKLCL